MAADSGSGGASINPTTKQSIVQKVLARAAAPSTAAGAGKKSTLLLSPAEPGQIIKFEGQSIVGSSNNNAIGQSTTARSSTTEGDENDFKITPDYIQESEYSSDWPLTSHVSSIIHL